MKAGIMLTIATIAAVAIAAKRVHVARLERNTRRVEQAFDRLAS